MNTVIDTVVEKVPTMSKPSRDKWHVYSPGSPGHARKEAGTTLTMLKAQMPRNVNRMALRRKFQAQGLLGVKP